MKIRHNVITLTLLASALLTGCSGGGGGSAPVPAPVTTAEGFWSGTASTGPKVALAILENGDTWGVYTSNNLIVGALHGTTTSSGTTLTGSGSDFNIPTRTVTPGTYSGTFASKSNVNITTSSGSNFTGTYDASYDTPASLTSLSGTFSGSGLTGSTSAQSATVGISSLGVVSSIGNGCSAAGTATPRPSNKNIFNVTITFTGTNCALGNGAVTTGIAYYDAANRQVLVMALNSAKTDGFIYVGVKP